jgi:hypothetical protein
VDAVLLALVTSVVIGFVKTDRSSMPKSLKERNLGEGNEKRAVKESQLMP